MTRQTDGKSLYEQQEERILAQSDAFISLLTKRGILGDHQIDNEKVRKAQQEKIAKAITIRCFFCSIIEILLGCWSVCRLASLKNWMNHLRVWTS